MTYESDQLRRQTRKQVDQERKTAMREAREQQAQERKRCG